MVLKYNNYDSLNISEELEKNKLFKRSRSITTSN